MNIKKHAIQIINNIVRKSYWYNELVFKDCKKFWRLNTNNIDVVNLGSSSGSYDFDYKEIGLNGYNWAIAPQTLVGDYAVIKQYKKYLKPGATLIFAICPFTSLSGAVSYVEERCYTILDFPLIPNAHYITKEKIMDIMNNPLQYYPLIQLKTDLLCMVKAKSSIRIYSDKQFNKDSLTIMNSWMTQFGLTDLTTPFTGVNRIEYDKSITLLTEIIDYSIDNGFKPVIVIPPMHNSLASLFSKSDRENLIDSFVNKANIRQIPYLNMMDDEKFTNDKSLFKSSYYLNEKGAKLYTKYLLEELHLIK